MTNEQIISKMKEDMKMRGFSHWTEESYLLKTKDIMKYFRKSMEEVEIEELRNFLLKHLREERKLSERSVNYYNSVIRFMYEVTMDKIINKKQLILFILLTIECLYIKYLDLIKTKIVEIYILVMSFELKLLK